MWRLFREYQEGRQEVDGLVKGHKEKARENLNELPAARGGRGVIWKPDAFQTWYAGDTAEADSHDKSAPSLAPSAAWEKNLSAELSVSDNTVEQMHAREMEARRVRARAGVQQQTDLGLEKETQRALEK